MDSHAPSVARKSRWVRGTARSVKGVGETVKATGPPGPRTERGGRLGAAPPTPAEAASARVGRNRRRPADTCVEIQSGRNEIRQPSYWLRWDASRRPRVAARHMAAWLLHDPPRRTR